MVTKEARKFKPYDDDKRAAWLNPYDEFLGQGPPSKGLGTAGDIYIDSTEKARGLYAKDIDNAWLRWNGPSNVDKLIGHPLFPATRFLWVRGLSAGWMRRSQIHRQHETEEAILGRIISSRASKQRKRSASTATLDSNSEKRQRISAEITVPNQSEKKQRIAAEVTVPNQSEKKQRISAEVTVPNQSSPIPTLPLPPTQAVQPSPIRAHSTSLSEQINLSLLPIAIPVHNVEKDPLPSWTILPASGPSTSDSEPESDQMLLDDWDNPPSPKRKQFPFSRPVNTETKNNLLLTTAPRVSKDFIIPQPPQPPMVSTIQDDTPVVQANSLPLRPQSLLHADQLTTAHANPPERVSEDSVILQPLQPAMVPQRIQLPQLAMVSTIQDDTPVVAPTLRATSIPLESQSLLHADQLITDFREEDLDKLSPDVMRKLISSLAKENQRLKQRISNPTDDRDTILSSSLNHKNEETEPPAAEEIPQSNSGLEGNYHVSPQENAATETQQLDTASDPLDPPKADVGPETMKSTNTDSVQSTVPHPEDLPPSPSPSSKNVSESAPSTISASPNSNINDTRHKDIQSSPSAEDMAMPSTSTPAPYATIVEQQPDDVQSSAVSQDIATSPSPDIIIADVKSTTNLPTSPSPDIIIADVKSTTNLPIEAAAHSCPLDRPNSSPPESSKVTASIPSQLKQIHLEMIFAKHRLTGYQCRLCLLVSPDNKVRFKNDTSPDVLRSHCAETHAIETEKLMKRFIRLELAELKKLRSQFIAWS